MLAPLDPYHVARQPDPAAYLAPYRQEDPVHWGAPLRPEFPGCWYLTRYDDIVNVLRDDRFRHARPRVGLENETPFTDYEFTVNDVLDRWFVFLDPPEHTTLRASVAKSLRAQMGPRLTVRVQELATQVVERLLGRGRCDIVSELAYPLPVMVITEVIGLPPGDHQRLIRWGQAFMGMFDETRPEAFAAGREAFRQFFEHFSRVFHERQDPTAVDVIGVYQQAHAAGQMTINEVLANAALILLAGSETAPTLIGNSLLLLLEHPQSREIALSSDEALRLAVDEVMRYQSPVQLTGRMATEDYQLRGKTIRQGDYVVSMYGAGNRDPEQFPDPDRFDVTRTVNRHLGFGAGCHTCVGASLGHLIVQQAVRAVLTGLEGVRMTDGQPQWRGHGSIRGLKSLGLEYDN